MKTAELSLEFFKSVKFISWMKISMLSGQNKKHRISES